MIEIIGLIVSAIFVLFLPGLAVTWAIFPKKDEIDWIERIALSFALSIAITPLLVFYFNFLLNVPINFITVSIVILGIMLTSAAIWFAREKRVFFSKNGLSRFS
ncbi:MAG: DUF1616 domain-containing protein [Candidatus Diapherotrites archaeon]